MMRFHIIAVSVLAALPLVALAGTPSKRAAESKKTAEDPLEIPDAARDALTRAVGEAKAEFTAAQGIKAA